MGGKFLTFLIICVYLRSFSPLFIYFIFLALLFIYSNKFVQICEYSHFFNRFFSFLTCSFPNLSASITHTIVLIPSSPHLLSTRCYQSITASFHALLQIDIIFCMYMCVHFICPRDFFLREGEDSLNLWNTVLAAVEISSFLTTAFALFSILF